MHNHTDGKKSATVFAHDFPFDPTYGYNLDSLLKTPYAAGPVDFADFWGSTYGELRATPLRLEKREITSPSADHRVFEVEFDSLDGLRIGGWLTIPSHEKPRRAVVVGHGYGGRGEADFLLMGPSATAALFVCKRGFHRSEQPGMPNTSHLHVLHGLESRDTYVHRGCTADVWAAASALEEIYPEFAGRLHYQGTSFGGGIGMLALPWDERFVKAYLDVPSFGNHPLRFTLPCVGSGQPIQELYQTQPEILDVLQYFDASTAARHLKIPIMIAAAKFDPAVPPPGQYAVYNAVESPKELFVREAAHFTYPQQEGEAEQLRSLLKDWFA